MNPISRRGLARLFGLLGAASFLPATKAPAKSQPIARLALQHLGGNTNTWGTALSNDKIQLITESVQGNARPLRPQA